MTGAAQGNVRNVLRLEGLGLFLAALALYHQQGFAWSMFFTWILLPDIALLAFLAGPRIGAIAYNITHSSIGLSCSSFWLRLSRFRRHCQFVLSGLRISALTGRSATGSNTSRAFHSHTLAG